MQIKRWLLWFTLDIVLCSTGKERNDRLSRYRWSHETAKFRVQLSCRVAEKRSEPEYKVLSCRCNKQDGERVCHPYLGASSRRKQVQVTQCNALGDALASVVNRRLVFREQGNRRIEVIIRNGPTMESLPAPPPPRVLASKNPQLPPSSDFLALASSFDKWQQ